MTVSHAFLRALLIVCLNVIWIYKWIIIIRALISWVNPDPYNPIVRILVILTEPVLKPLRRLLHPRKMGGFDFSPVLVFLILYFLEVFIQSLMLSLGIG